MAVPFSNTKLRVPRGFQNLLEGLAREVLRNQPEELYAFGAQYFETLIKQREESGIDPTENGAKMEDRFYNNKAFTQPEIDPSDPTQQDAALAIQTKFRQHAAKQEVEVIREEKAATKIQAGFRGHQGRTQTQDGEVGDTSADTVAAAQEEEVVDIDLTDPDVEAAAIKIQASFKGFQTRKTMKTAADSASPEIAGDEDKRAAESPPTQAAAEEEIDIDLADPDVEKAAVKIQAGFKGMKARQRVRDIKEENENSSQIYEVTELMSPVPMAVLRTASPVEMLVAAEREPQQIRMCAAPEYYDEPTMCAAPEYNDEPEELEMCAAPEYNDEPELLAEQEPELLAKCAAPEYNDEEAEIDIDLGDPDVEKAAVKIQAGFKGMQARREVQQKRQGSGKSIKSVTEPSTEEVAATTEEVTASASETKPETPKPAEEEIDIDLEDPEVEAAAVKIQAGFKGLKTRRDIAARKSAESQGRSKPGSAGATEAAAEQAPAADAATAETSQEPAESTQKEADTIESAPADSAPAVAADSSATTDTEPAVQPTEQPTEPPAEPTETLDTAAEVTEAEPPAETAQPPAEAAQPPAEAAQPPSEADQAPAEAEQPATEVNQAPAEAAGDAAAAPAETTTPANPATDAAPTQPPEEKPEQTEQAPAPDATE